MPTKMQKRSSSKKRRVPLHDTVSTPSPANQSKINVAIPNKPTGISTSVRRIVVQRPETTLGEISDALIELGWDKFEIIRRWSAISTLRSDALAVLTLAQQHGWVMQGKLGRAR